MRKKTVCALAGLAAGAINGLLGAGGGPILVPVFTRILKLEEKTALASSIAVMTPVCALSAAVYLLSGQTAVLQALPFVLGGVLGGVVGGRCFKKVPSAALGCAFGLLMLYGGVRAVFF